MNTVRSNWPTRVKLRIIVYAIFIVMAAGTLYNHITDTTADNGAACTVIGLFLIFVFEVAYSFADARAKRHEV